MNFVLERFPARTSPEQNRPSSLRRETRRRDQSNWASGLTRAQTTQSADDVLRQRSKHPTEERGHDRSCCNLVRNAMQHVKDENRRRSYCCDLIESGPDILRYGLKRVELTSHEV